MDIRHVKYFIAVAEELHFGRAARRLRISQPPLSQQIKALEEELGITLFDRNRHKVSLTARGEAMLGEAYRLLAQADRFTARVNRMTSGSTTPLHIGCVPSALFDILPPIMEKLHATHPAINVSLQDFETASAVSALKRGELDVGLFRLRTVEPPIKMRLLMRDHIVLALHHQHPLTRYKRITLTRLNGEPFVLFARKHEPREHDRIVAACNKAGFSPGIEYQVDSIQSQLGLVACGLAVGLVPSISRDWRVPRVVYRPLDVLIRSRDLSLVWNDASRSEAVDIFLNTAKVVFPRPRGPALDTE